MFLQHYPYYLLTVTLFTIAGNAFSQQQTIKDSLQTRDLRGVTIHGKTNTGELHATKITRKELEVIQSATLGETLNRIPGIQNSYFGPNAGAPVIRSLSGNRVQTLSNGISMNDLSGISPNLNVQTDMDNLLGIDVYKTGASILYGGKAIGGAINLHDNTIPNKRFPQKITGFATGEASTNNGYKQAFDLNGNIGKHWAWHFGGMNHWNKKVRIPGNTKAPIAFDPTIDNLTQTMAQVTVDKEIIRNLSVYPYLSQFVLDNMNNPAWGLSEADLYTFQETSMVDGKAVQNPKNDKYIPGQDPNTPLTTTVIKGIYDYSPVTKGIMPNSHSEARSVNVGTSYIRDHFYAGIGYRGAYSYYGIPGFALRKLPGHSHSHNDGSSHVTPGSMVYRPINVESQQNNFLFESGWSEPVKGISSVKINYMLQLADDRELTGRATNNRFQTIRHTTRLEIEQQPLSFLKGMSGIDFAHANIKGAGEQRYLPDNESRDYAAFTLQRVEFRALHADVGYRYEVATRRATTGNGYTPSRGLAGGKLLPRDFHLQHFHGGLQWDVYKIGYLKASYIHAERAPGVNELYAGNNHYAIMLEENGDDRLKKEISNTQEYTAGIDYKGMRISISRYQTIFNNYLYLAHTGISRSGGFLVKEWRQSDTKINGWEAEAVYATTITPNMTGEIASYFDLVKNKNNSDNTMRQWAEGDYMPNMPTSRFGASTKLNWRTWTLNIMFDRYLEQRYLGKNINPEPPMPAYSLLAARVSYKSNIKKMGIVYYLSGNNLLNTEARPQNSFLKYLAPLPGRNVAFGIKASI
ncbi:iron complex outermembrane receptor protein [Chitinophaga skermanii]|uniref:Iron complex outermembrane receptor protein n=1 Tax=Chitinophaga skermanii TaxID=331697 RepID=A0A327QLR3_9BACT|nr:TonB-dependent receptor plug domain-containing protein [Chitinophaga skermanii]RAJ05499.1 iron complex outermembrane receptor protein [Chitinophaga skermanii]